MPSIVDLAEICNAVYSKAAAVVVHPPGFCSIDAPRWRLRKSWEGVFTGFTAGVYAIDRQPDTVLAFAGTDSLWDILIDDAQIFAGQVPQQALQAIAVARQQSGNVYLTGHSLGGALAIIAAAHTGAPAVTFNAPGVMDSCVRSTILQTKNGLAALIAAVQRCVGGSRILNIRIAGDPVSSAITTGLQSGTTRPSYSAAQCGLNALCRHGMATCIDAVRREKRNFEPLNL